MEKQNPQYIENPALAREMAYAESIVRTPAADLAHALGKTTAEFYTPDQLAFINVEATAHGDKVTQEIIAEAEKQRMQQEIEPVAQTALLSTMAHKRKRGSKTPADKKGIPQEGLAPEARGTDEFREAIKLFEDKVEAGERSVGIGKAALMFGFAHEAIGTSLPAQLKEGAVGLYTQPLHNEQIIAPNNGSPVLIRAAGNVPEDAKTYNGGEVFAVQSPTDNKWHVYTLRDIGESKYKELLPGEDGTIKLGRHSSDKDGVHAFGAPSGDLTEFNATAATFREISDQHATLSFGEDGTMTIADHSKKGTTYQQAFFTRDIPKA
ncbi:MAG TPA: hypothetical protein VLG16_01240 [Candidatus Saccharimonadales bacterium]|nr:hypothetical protein [Candidatus Saccharimonadales bacterium]